jgi:hypothetical protein
MSDRVRAVTYTIFPIIIRYRIAITELFSSMGRIEPTIAHGVVVIGNATAIE